MRHTHVYPTLTKSLTMTGSGTAEGIGAGSSPFGAGFGDVFEDLFGDFFGTFTGQRRKRPAKGNDLRYDLDITLMEAAFGTEKILRFQDGKTVQTAKEQAQRREKRRQHALIAKAQGRSDFSRVFSVFPRHAANVTAKAGLSQTRAKHAKDRAGLKDTGR